MGDLICGDAREVLAGMDEGSVHACISSPPYWGLRDYGGPDSVFGGDESCQHEWGPEIPGDARGGSGPNAKEAYADGGKSVYARQVARGNICQFCGAWRGQFGLEPTPEMYVGHTLEFLRAIRRVLRDDGTVWWVIGDSYASGKGTCYNPGGGDNSLGKNRKEAGAHPLDRGNISTLRENGLKPKDLVMIPFRVVLAAQADGWWVRSVIIWSKPNPMPESVRDRPTTAHEYVLLLTKSVRYFYDADAMREPLAKATVERERSGYNHAFANRYKGSPTDKRHLEGKQLTSPSNPAGRNKRTVWEIATQPFSGPHYATFPAKLVEPMILTTPTKVCAECGAGWERVVERSDTGQRMKMPDGWDTGSGGHGSIHREGREKDETGRAVTQTNTVGFRPTCSCPGLDGDGPGSDCADYETNWPTEKAVILDPFCGTGTVCWQANALGRDWIGVDIDPKSIEMAKDRMGLFSIPRESA